MIYFRHTYFCDACFNFDVKVYYSTKLTSLANIKKAGEQIPVEIFPIYCKQCCSARKGVRSFWCCFLHLQKIKYPSCLFMTNIRFNLFSPSWKTGAVDYMQYAASQPLPPKVCAAFLPHRDCRTFLENARYFHQVSPDWTICRDSSVKWLIRSNRKGLKHDPD